MNRSRIAGAGLAAALLLPAHAEAQHRTLGDDLRNAGRDAWFIVSSPAHATGSDLRTLGLLAAGAGVALVLDEPVHAWLAEDPLPARVLTLFGEGSPLSITGRTWFFLLPLSGSLYAAGHAFDSSDLKDAGLGCATANLTTTLTRTATALLVGRLRPLVGEGAFHFRLFAFGGWDERSFPGGHASNIMSCASYFNHRFDLGIAEPAIWALASGVGLARIADQAHWTSDTFVGMAYGFAVGRNVADRFTDRAVQRQAERSLQPGIVVGWKITF